VRDEIERYRSSDVQPFGINFGGLESHRRYGDKLKLPFPLLSDPDRAVARAYGALKPDGRRIQRTVVVIDRDGTVRFAARGAPGVDRNLEPFE
jgi:peroxiredoxin